MDSFYIDPHGASPYRFFEGLITSLRPEQVFVFGSNPQGIHGAGAARTAFEKFGAVMGQGYGLQGQSYAIATKDLRVKENNAMRSVPLDDIYDQIKKLNDFAYWNQDKEFFVTAIGSELAGYNLHEIAEGFIRLTHIEENLIFDKRLWDIIFLGPFS